MQEASIRGIQWVSIGAIVLGLLFIIAGAITTGVAYTEITPPNYDENYDRYIGSSVPRLIGPFVLCFGALILLGSCGIMCFQVLKQESYINNSEQHEPMNQSPYLEKDEDESIHSQKGSP